MNQAADQVKQEWMNNGGVPATLVVGIEDLEVVLNQVLVDRPKYHRVIAIFKKQFDNFMSDLENIKSTLVGLKGIVEVPTKNQICSVWSQKLFNFRLKK